MNKLDVVIPVHNESDNIIELLQRLEKALVLAGIKYNVFVVDNASSDGTDNKVKKYLKKNSSAVKLLYKKELGKAYAILKGISEGKSGYVAMIDGDLQYPPEAIPEMFKLAKKAGVVVANRKKNETSALRKIGTKVNRYVFEKKLLGLDCDTQSGLKVFRREITKYLKEEDVKPWSIDMPLLVIARKLGYKIETVDIDFKERRAGVSKVNFVKTGFQIASTALKLKLSEAKPFVVLPKNNKSAIGAGIVYKNRRFITHSKLSLSQSAFETLSRQQKIFLGLLALLLLTGLFINTKTSLIVLIATLSSLYFLDFLFTTLVVFRSVSGSHELKFSEKSLKSLRNKELPVYTILCPLYKEARVLKQFVDSIDKLDWPKGKLDVILLLEKDDKETLSAAKKHAKSYIKTLVVPHSLPKTKPKACNFGLAHAKGEYVVIYDAEDKPDPLQLKKALLGFKNSSSKVVCLQSKLNYYNPDQNLLTRLFTSEYSLWFDLILPGLQSLKTIIPLGGTSNHFKLATLRELGGWDAFNVTEDCDLGTRLFKKGYKTAIIDSTTFEEANSKVKSWLRQRSRWIKGYLQTYFVHTRNPISFARDHGIQALVFQLVIGMRMVFIMINPILWLVTISYFALRASLGPAIEALYPGPVLYMAIFPMVFGNFLYFYNYMIACAKREKWYLIKYVFLIPFYWVMVSVASFIAFYQLVVKPHYWEKTEHGLHLAGFRKKREVKSTSSQKALGTPTPAPSKSFGWSTMTSFVKPYTRKDGLTIGALVLMASTGLVSFIDFLYNAYLGRKLDLTQFGTVALLGNILTIAGVLGSALIRVTTHKSGFLLGKYNTPVKGFWLRIKSRIWMLSLGLTVLWLVAMPILSNYFNTESWLPFLLFTPFWSVGYLVAVNSGFLSGSLKFSSMALIYFTESFTKLVAAILAVETGNAEYVYAAIPFSAFCAYLVSSLFISRISNSKIPKTIEEDLKFPREFFFAALLTNVSVVGFLSVDVVMAKHYLSPEIAGQYALLSLAGKIIYLLTGVFGQFINPIISRHEGQGRVSKRAFYILLLGISSISLLGYLVIGVFGYISMPLLFGENAEAIVDILPLYGIGVVAYSIASFFAVYHQVRRHYIFSVLAFVITIAQVVYISMFHSSIETIALVTTFTGIFFLVYSVILHVTHSQLTVVSDNIRDFLDLFSTSVISKNGRLKILIFNWRDTKHVWAGGAEIYIHEIAKRCVQEGHEVTLFCGNDGKNKREERIDGIKTIRRGGFFTVYLWAFFYYIFKFRRRFDVIIDCQNGVPFFTPFYSSAPKILLIHHIHQSVFRENLVFPLSTIAMFLESKVMPFAYKNVKMVTVSKSSKLDMVKMGLSKDLIIDIVHPGIDVGAFKPAKKSKQPSLLYLGRLKAYKSIDTVIRALPMILDNHPKAKLHIAGFGEARRSLESLTKSLSLTKNVKFWGKVSDRVRLRLMQSSWVFVYPSTMEGWGISVIEANACATPVVASDVPGLRDSVRNPSSGFLVAPKKEDEFAEKINLLLSDPKLRDTLSKESVKWAKEFTWEKSADRFLTIIENTVRSEKFVVSDLTTSQVKASRGEDI